MRSGKPHLVESDNTRQVKDFMVAHGWRSIRNQRMVLPGTFQTGEPGMPDMVFIRYLQNGVALVLWVEFKKPGDNRKCTCVKNAGTRRRCTVCDQKAWRDRERQRGGIVWTVADVDRFMQEYDRLYSWLHSGETGRGQLDLLAGGQS